LFRRYVTLHGLAVVVAFAVAVVWIIISATRHTTAQRICLQKFFPDETGTSGEGQTMCNIFPWVSIGVMGALWAVLAIFFVRSNLPPHISSADVLNRSIFGLY